MSFRIAIAEDDPVNRQLLERLFAASGFEVVLAGDGTEALALLEGGGIDLLLLDIMMPGQSGVEVLKTAREKGFDLPIIMLTALDSPESVAEALDAGADDYVSKPFSPKVLLARVKLRLRPARDRVPAPPPPPPPSDAVELSPDDVVEASPPPAPPESSEAPASNQGLMRSFLTRLKRAVSQDKTAASPPSLSPGTLLAERYRVGEVLGRGTFGVVHRARHLELEMDVAIKVLRADSEQVPDGVSLNERFRREAIRSCRVRHDHAVRVLDFGVTTDERPFLVMELLRGPTLEARLQQGPLAPREAAQICAKVLSAVAAAHKQGVVHQDVKASNVVLAESDDGEPNPKLIDFGAAVELSDKPSAIRLGTVSHMAPERFVTGACDAKGDVYAAAVMLYRSVTGRLPFVHDDVEELAKLHTNAVPVPPSQIRPELSPAWDVALSRLLAKSAAERPTAAEGSLLVATLS